MSTRTIRKLVKSDKSSFISVMSSAFAHDPLFVHLFGDPESDRKAVARANVFTAFMFDKGFLSRDEIWGSFDDGVMQGAYILERSDVGKLRHIIGGMLQIGRFIPLLFQLPFRVITHLNSYMQITRAVAPTLQHDYLVMIGVSPDIQGKGVGRSLLDHLLYRVDKDPHSQGVALDTENAHNKALYERFGFRLTAEKLLEQLPIYCMFFKKE
ncbi:GNAT family N-acetyltransferase [Paenibacillus sp. GSMTC-2017]|uniref:GNAT family N-acetyltransferase n=1 Tax=Paenibacillus sp. GSMTC-2017 TaxID=2794350 RepID=UPI0018D8084D|nr:GNAT family N-acetyltransferase [Paenibacillus sp. GSMTC-2017]MBH5319696.1 GNAT family N-acetyltransferase [Paenibacillus sp. GSMTC-2017]